MKSTLFEVQTNIFTPFIIYKALSYVCVPLEVYMHVHACTHVYDGIYSASNLKSNHVESKLVNTGARTKNLCPLTPKFMYGISRDMII